MADEDELAPNLDEIESRCSAATAGPWRSFVEGRDHFGGDDFIRTGGLDDASPDMYVSLGSVPASASDLDFIAHARQDVPNLVAALRDTKRQRPHIEGSERSLVDANVDYGNISGYFVRLDIEIPIHGLSHQPGERPVSGYLILTPDEADDLSRLLAERASAARTAQT